MTLEFIFVVQIIILLAVVLDSVDQWRKKTPKAPRPVKHDESKRPIETPDTPAIWQVLHRNLDGGWHHEGWVREGSIAWQRAHDTPGMALRRETKAEVVEGIQ